MFFSKCACFDVRNEIKHAAEEKATRHVDESTTDDTSTDTEDVIEWSYRCVVWTNPRMMVLSNKSTQNPDNHILTVSVRAATSAERDADDAELDANDACKKFMTTLIKWSCIILCRSIRGEVKVMARASHEGITSLLCVDKGCLSVVGGAELDVTGGRWNWSWHLRHSEGPLVSRQVVGIALGHSRHEDRWLAP
jgi:hypothetical protein